MHALLLVANVIALHTTEAPSLVLDGCNTASAERASAIATMDPAAPETLGAVVDLLDAPDGAICLMESWTLVKLYHAQPAARAWVATTLAWGLADGAMPHVSARAAHLTRILGVGDADAFAVVARRVETSGTALDALRTELDAMRAGTRRSELVASLAEVAPAMAPATANVR